MGNIGRVIDGLEIFRRYRPEMRIYAEHDMLYGPHAKEIALPEEEQRQLKALGWRINPDVNCWALGI